MSEIEQLRQDIATMEAAQNLIADGDGNGSWLLHDNIVERKKQLAKLESEAAAAADPWAVEKSLVKGYLTDLHASTYGQMVAKYAQHLEQRVAELEKQLASEKQQVDNVDSVVYVLSNDLKKAQDRIAELEAELARRPVVWCNRLSEDECLRDVSGHVKVYTDKEKNDCFLVRGRFEPYTGEQS